MTDDLVSEVRLRAWLPDADDLSDSEILTIATGELHSLVAAAVKVGREEHWVTTLDVTADERVRVPRRALGRALRGITVVDANGDEGPFEVVPAGEAWRWSSTTDPAVGYLEDDELVLCGTVSSSYSIRFRYLTRPSRLVMSSACAPIDSPNGTTAVYLQLVGSSYGTTDIKTTDALVDIVRGDEPYPVIFADRRVASFAELTGLVFDSSTPIVEADISSPGASSPPGWRTDYVCIRDTTCYPPIPHGMWEGLVLATVAALHEAQKNDVQAANARARARAAVDEAQALMEPRVHGRSTSIVRRDGALRTGRGRWR